MVMIQQKSEPDSEKEWSFFFLQKTLEIKSSSIAVCLLALCLCAAPVLCRVATQWSINIDPHTCECFTCAWHRSVLLNTVVIASKVLSCSDKAVDWLTTQQPCACLEIPFHCQLYRCYGSFLRPKSDTEGQLWGFSEEIQLSSSRWSKGGWRRRRQETLPLFWPNTTIPNPL